MSLRTRLLLAFGAGPLLVLVVGIVAYQLNRDVEQRLDDLRVKPGVDLSDLEVSRHGLEIEGTWDEAGFFRGREVDLLPGTRRPKLRGPLQAVDAAARTLNLYGIEIAAREGTSFDGRDLRAGDFEELAVGQRVEVSAQVEAGRWLARKIKTSNVKTSDKVKGTLTSLTREAGADRIEIEGLRVVLDPDRGEPSQSALRDLRLATLMTADLHDVRALVRELVGRADSFDESAAQLGLETEQSDLTARERLHEAMGAFAHYLDELDAKPRSAGVAPTRERALLIRLTEEYDELGRLIGELDTLVATEPARADDHVDRLIEPHIAYQILPVVYALRSEAEESLDDSLRAISQRTSSAMRMAIGVSVAAAALAMLLGWTTWRSVDGPLRALHDAARRVGDGQLDTRVAIRAGGELGVLADAFDSMAQALARTTVSVESLAHIFDSMAGVLIMLDADRRITKVNRGALALLGYELDELVGRPFELICAEQAHGNSDRPLWSSEAERVAVTELTLVRRDGSAVPVSFSSAVTGGSPDRAQGYVCTAQDISDRKALEEQLRSSLGGKDLLLRELHHRVKNNMQIISSLLAIQASCSSDDNTVVELEESRRCIQAMALIHEQLHDAADVGVLDVGSYFESLAGRIVQSFGVSHAAEIVVESPAERLGIDQAVTCGLIVNELVTNSLKHALTRAGRVRIGIAMKDLEDGNRLLEVFDDGPGIEAYEDFESDERPLGLALVTTLARQLGGDVSIGTGAGARVTVQFPRVASDWLV